MRKKAKHGPRRPEDSSSAPDATTSIPASDTASSSQAVIPQPPALLPAPQRNDETIVRPGAVAIVGMNGSPSPSSSDDDDDSNREEDVAGAREATDDIPALPELSARLVNVETEAEQALRIQELERQLREAQRKPPDDNNPQPTTAEAVVLDVRVEDDNNDEREETTATSPQRSAMKKILALTLVGGALLGASIVVVLVVFLAIDTSPSTTAEMMPSVSAEPSSSVSAEPSSFTAPTSIPTPSPSTAPTSIPTPSPSASPSRSAAPSTSPSRSAAPSAPTPACILRTGNVRLVVARGEYAGETYGLRPQHTPQLEVQSCLQRPYGITMLYNGGSCEQSDNRQGGRFNCTDTETGPPPTRDGDRSFIRVEDASGKGVQYFRDWVTVGDTYYLKTPTGLDVFEENQTISIFRNPETRVAENLLQMATFDGSCRSNLELKSRFGASQLVEFVNELQGNVSCFAKVDLPDLELVIPIQNGGMESVRLERLTALTNFQGFFDLSDYVQGIIVPPGDTVDVNIPNITIDVLEKGKHYTVLTQITGVASPSGAICAETNFANFSADGGGSSSQGNNTTVFPTKSPSVSSLSQPPGAPTPL